MGERIMAGGQVQHTNGKVYSVAEIRLVGGRNVAMGREMKDGWVVGRLVILALDKLAPTVVERIHTVIDDVADATDEVSGVDCDLTAQRMADLTGNRWEDCYPAVPTVEAAHEEFMATDGGFEDTDPTDVVSGPLPAPPSGSTHPDGVTSDRPLTSRADHIPPTDHELGEIEDKARSGMSAEDIADFYTDPTDPTDPTPPGWDSVDTSTDDTPPMGDDESTAIVNRAVSTIRRRKGGEIALGSVASMHAMAKAGQSAEQIGDRFCPDPAPFPSAPSPLEFEDIDDTPPRPLTPNDEAGPITTDDLRQCRRELRRKVAIHCAGEAPMTPGSLSVALRTLAAIDRAITGKTANRPATGKLAALPMPSEPGPLGVYDRQGNVKSSRRRRRHADKIRAPRSIFRARSDRKPRPVPVHGGRAFGPAPSSAN